ncbi:unnamed protein product [Adineta ricciae]|uniref:MAM domain-containing protein n=1 Tax=Adineta ricciae TaxID=249248 RepID=A0A813ZYC6_ADIRI|nr:unnamed protein product [Adineta ricciae]
MQGTDVAPTADQIELYVPRKCAASNKIIAAKDHAAVQLDIAEVDEHTGVATGKNRTYALCGSIRMMGESDDSICNFDGNNENCFTTTITVTASAGVIGRLAPDKPLSDVSSSLKSTENGENCTLPYSVNDYTWDMYFCNKNYCPTKNNPSSRCRDGKFGNILLTSNTKRTYQLKTVAGGIDGVNEQCLFYYYYMSNMTEKVIEVRKEEADGTSEIIDSVTTSPYNGWVIRTIQFNARATNYKIFFEVQKTAGSQLPTIAFDEISIIQGACGGTDTTTSSSSTTTSVMVQTSSTTTMIPVETTTSTTLQTTDRTTTTTTTTTPEDTTELITTTTTLTTTATTTTTTPEETTQSTTTTTTTTSTTTPVETTEQTTTTTTTTTTTPEETTQSTTTTTTATTSTTTPVETTEQTTTTTTTTTPEETTQSTITTTTTTSTTTPVETTERTTTTTTTTTITSSTEIIEPTTITTTTMKSDTTSTTPSETTITHITSTGPEEVTTQSPTSTTTSTTIMSSRTSSSTTSLSQTTSSTSMSTESSESSLPSSTTSPIETVVISSYETVLPREKSHIIVMATVISIVWIAFIIAVLWARRSTGVLGGINDPFTDSSRSGESSGSYELGTVSDA